MDGGQVRTNDVGNAMIDSSETASSHQFMVSYWPAVISVVHVIPIHIMFIYIVCTQLSGKRNCMRWAYLLLLDISLDVLSTILLQLSVHVMDLRELRGFIYTIGQV